MNTTIKPGDCFVGENGVYLVLHKKGLTDDRIWVCLVLADNEYWHDKAGDLVDNVEEWLFHTCVRAESL